MRRIVIPINFTGFETNEANHVALQKKDKLDTKLRLFSDENSFQVTKIKIEKLYNGVSANFQEDIAILILTTPIKYETYILPVCLDFNLNFESLQLQNGVLGKVCFELIINFYWKVCLVESK